VANLALQIKLLVRVDFQTHVADDFHQTRVAGPTNTIVRRAIEEERDSIQRDVVPPFMLAHYRSDQMHLHLGPIPLPSQIFNLL
jgi:hypothetical protein